MTTKLQKWGNSQGLRLPKSLLERIGLRVGAKVNVVAEGQRIIVRPLRQVRGKYKIEDLAAAMPRNYKSGGDVWGKAMGREVW